VPVQVAVAGEAARRHVLVVDDNADAAHSLDMILKFSGHQTRVALDGTEGLKIAQDFHPEIVVLDIGMPGLNGFEVARRLRQMLGDQVYIIALSGYGAAEDRQRALAAGFDVHMVKPIEIEQLTQLISRGKR